MIDYVRGILTYKAPALAVVEAGGVGYAIEIPLSTFQSLPAEGAETRLLTHHHVREDTQKLFGFLTASERDLFRELISVNQVGPKVALSVLSRVSVTDLVDAVTRADTARLKAVPGIGPKTAERLVIELRGKLKGISAAPVPGRVAGGKGSSRGSVRQETFDALLSLGYNDQQVARALDRVGEVLDDKAPIEDWIRKALQVM